MVLDSATITNISLAALSAYAAASLVARKGLVSTIDITLDENSPQEFRENLRDEIRYRAGQYEGSYVAMGRELVRIPVSLSSLVKKTGNLFGAKRHEGKIAVGSLSRDFLLHEELLNMNEYVDPVTTKCAHNFNAMPRIYSSTLGQHRLFRNGFGGFSTMRMVNRLDDCH